MHVPSSVEPNTAPLRRIGAATLLVTGLLGLLWLLYLPGINGGVFLFDDNPNLSVLGELGTVDSWEKLITFLQSGIAGPTGRPVSLLSFLLDGRSWPTDPYPFLRTNTLLHGLNACLVFFCIWQIANRTRSRESSPIALALIATALWAFHPYWVSTVLYAVQRMALLSAFFVLIGLNGYLWGRTHSLNGCTERKGWFIVIVSTLVATTLATLSKENGALLPVYLLLFETIVIRQLWQPTQAPNSFPSKIWRHGLQFYLLGILAYLAYTTIQHGFFEQGARAFTLYERLLTEPRILFGYLYDLLIPKPGYAGLFYDDYPFSTGLLQPPITLLAILGLGILIGLAMMLRHRWPWFSLAVGFYLAGHLIESTILSLELAFEHRNYLPAVFLFVPVTQGLLKLPAHRTAAVAATLALMMFFTHQHARLWGEPVKLGVYWAIKNPHSDRAAILAAGRLKRAGQPKEALILLERALQHRSDSAALNLALLWNKAEFGIAGRKDVKNAIAAIESGPYDPHLVNMLSLFVDGLYSHRTRHLSPSDTERILSAFERRREYAAQAPIDIKYQMARIALFRQDMPSACTLFLQAAQQADRIGTDLQIMSQLATRGYLHDARIFLERARHRLESDQTSSLKFSDALYRRELRRLTSELDDQQARRGSLPPECSPSPPVARSKEAFTQPSRDERLERDSNHLGATDVSSRPSRLGSIPDLLYT